MSWPKELFDFYRGYEEVNTYLPLSSLQFHYLGKYISNLTTASYYIAEKSSCHCNLSWLQFSGPIFCKLGAKLDNLMYPDSALFMYTHFQPAVKKKKKFVKHRQKVKFSVKVGSKFQN